MGKPFSNLVAKLKKQKGVKNPAALAAWIGRKHGKIPGKNKESMDSLAMIDAVVEGSERIMKSSSLIEQVTYGEDPWRVVRKLTELHDPYDEQSFQDGLKKVGDMLVKCCRQLDDLRTMIGLPQDKANQLDEATVKCSDAVKSVKVMLHDSLNPPAPDAEDDDGRALQSPPPTKSDEDDEPSVVIDPLKPDNKKESRRRRR